MLESEAIQSVFTQAAVQAATAMVMAMREAGTGPISGTNTSSSKEAHRQRYDRPDLEQLSFNCNAPDRYAELLNFKMEVTNILQIKTYKVTDEENIPIIKNWLGRVGIQLIQTSMNTDKETCRTLKGLFSTIDGKFKSHHNQTILSLQCCKLKRKYHEAGESLLWGCI